MKSNNPTLKFEKFLSITDTDTQPMTIQGTIIKTIILLMTLVSSASFSWYLFSVSSTIWFPIATTIGLVGAIVTGLYTIFKPHVAPITAPLYALFEGLALGAFSIVAEREVPGVGLCAVYLTFGTLIAMLLAYRLEIIKVNETFKGILISSIGGIFIIYVLDMILSFFGSSIPFINSAGVGGIIFSLFVVAIAALNLVLDFDFIYQASGYQLPKRAEWYAGFSLMVSLVWLYMEIVRLVIKLSRRR